MSVQSDYQTTCIITPCNYQSLRFCTTKNDVNFFLTEMSSLKFGSNIAFIATNLLWLLSGRNDFCFTKSSLQ